MRELDRGFRPPVRFEMELLLGVLASVIAAALLFAFRRVRNWGREAWQALTRFRPRTPRYSIRVLPQMGGCRWQLQERGGETVAWLHASLYATNVIGNPVFLLNAFIRKPRVEGSVHVEGPVDPELDLAPIRPGGTVEVLTYFTLNPVLVHEGEDFRATMVLVDQFGNEHKIKHLVFAAQARAKVSPRPKIKRELVSALIDPIERNVAILLQEEVHRLQSARSAKQLGSIRINLSSPQELTATGHESLESDVIDQLDSLYRNLSSAEDRVKFVDALLSRLRSDSEYGAVGYLILFFLFKVGELSKALATAQQSLLLTIDQRTQDFLRVLDLLLCVYPADFRPELLDDVEQFLQRNPELPPYRIRERLARIRVLLVAVEQLPKEGG